MIITKETDYALRILRVLLDGEKHSVAEMSETELIPNQFAYQILRKLSAGNLVRVSRDVYKRQTRSRSISSALAVRIVPSLTAKAVGRKALLDPTGVARCV